MHPKALLDAATELMRLALRFDHPFDAVAQRYFREQRALGARDRALLSDMAYSILRRKQAFDHLARQGAQGVKPPKGMTPERRLAILGLGLQGGETAHGLEAALTPEEAAWLHACAQADRSEWPEACHHNLPDWLADRLRVQVGEGAFGALADALLQPAPLDLRTNVMKEKRTSVQEQLARDAIETEATPYSPWGLRVAGKPSLAKLDVYQRGAIEVQDEGSQLLALLVDARRGDMVADFCAGAGGKALAMGAAMRNTGRLYAFDTSAHRLQALKPRLEKSGLTIVYPTAIAHENDERLARLAGKMDRVLVDAPCSGLGTLRRSPDLKWRQKPADIDALATQQQAILSAAARLVKPGGRLVYATCSPLPEENEAVAEAFDAAQGRVFVPLAVVELLTAARVAQAASLCSADGHYLRLWPHRHGTDGFFAAAWHRTS